MNTLAMIGNASPGGATRELQNEQGADQPAGDVGRCELGAGAEQQAVEFDRDVGRAGDRGEHQDPVVPGHAGFQRPSQRRGHDEPDGASPADVDRPEQQRLERVEVEHDEVEDGEADAQRPQQPALPRKKQPLVAAELVLDVGPVDGLVRFAHQLPPSETVTAFAIAQPCGTSLAGTAIPFSLK